MTDRELLGLVANAVGMQIDPIDAAHVPDQWVNWNPLTDDGDAFRLGVACGVLGSREVAHHKALLCLFSDYDKLELERRAIVLAVAEAQQAKEAQ